MNSEKWKLILVFIVLGLASIGPNLFPAAQAGYVQLSEVARQLLLPSILGIGLLMLLMWRLGYQLMLRQVGVGVLAGIVGTIGLEVFRVIGFEIGWMPGELPKLMGVLLLDQFATGPDATSNLAGWAYHFWNGAAFGIIYSLMVSKGKPHYGIVYGILVGIGFMVSPVVQSLGIGKFGLEYKDGYQFLVTVTLAHVAFGILLGWLAYLLNPAQPHLLSRVKLALDNTPT